MTGLLMALLIITAIVGAIAWARHISQAARPPCRHAPVVVADGEVDECWSCHKPRSEW